MSMSKMHPDEIDIDGALVARLIATQFPRWAHLPIVAVRSAGTDNAIYRLGEDMAVRLPRLPRAAEMVDKEQQWLPRLAPLLPLAVPVPLGAGTPDDEFPYPWSVCRWLAGKDLADEPHVDLHDVAVGVGRFLAALRRIDTTGGPTSTRAEPVSSRDDDDVRSTIGRLAADGVIDSSLAITVWEAALAAPAWDGPPSWIHGDLFPANLLATRGRLSGVIDFGLLGLGDPACDMLVAWTLLTADTRDAFRAEARVDEATWVRGRGWALSAGLGAVRVYRVINPVLAAAGRHAITETLADYRHTA
jgi:aminoglycoside phosphotransferase (APT) family kinase protein